jgi:hypothetical protein
MTRATQPVSQFGAIMSNRPELSFGQLPSAIGGWAEAPRTPRSPVAPRGSNFDPDERRRRIVQIEVMIAEMAHAADHLDREIEAEQVRAGINDPTHYAYPTYAKAAGARRDNLRRSIEQLKEYL